MRKYSSIILCSLAIAIIVSGCGIDCIEKKTGLYKSSESLKDARANNLYKFEMKPSKNKFLLDSGGVFIITNAWIENEWRYECVNNQAEIFSDSSLQFVIDAKYMGKVSASKYLLIKTDNTPGALGCYLESSLVFNYLNKDTVTVLLAKEPVPLASQSDRVIIDTIRFVKKYN